ESCSASKSSSRESQGFSGDSRGILAGIPPGTPMPQAADRGLAANRLSSPSSARFGKAKAMDMAIHKDIRPKAHSGLREARPGEPTGTAAAAGPLDAIDGPCRFIEAKVAEGERFPLAELGAHCRLSPWHLQRQFRRVMGVSPHDYADQHRLARFRDELQQGEGVAAATYGAGYGSSSRAYERADSLIGSTPAAYARGGKGADSARGPA